MDKAESRRNLDTILAQAEMQKAANGHEKKLPYIDTAIIVSFSEKDDSFNYKKLVELLTELNENYAAKRVHSCYLSIKSILNHIPPLLGQPTFKQVVSNYGWSQSHKKYIERLAQFLDQADDVTHTIISDRQDHSSVDDVPPRQYINTLLEECLKKSAEQKPLPPSSKTVADKLSIPGKTKATMKTPYIKWARNYAVFNGSCFHLEVTIDNYLNSKPNIIRSMKLLGTAAKGTPWVGDNYVVERVQHDERPRVEANDVRDFSVFISNFTPGTQGHPMPGLDRDTISLEVEFMDGTTSTAKVSGIRED